VYQSAKLSLPIFVGVSLVVLCAGRLAAQSMSRFQHVVVLVQENRTPDNLFHGLLTWPGINPANYNLASSGLARVNGQQVSVLLTPEPLGTDYDPGHSHKSFTLMYDGGQMDGANLIQDRCSPSATDCTNNGQGQFLSYKYVDNSTHVIDPYLKIAANYGWANFMFQTNQGPSYPAHQFLFGGTSALTASDDAMGRFVAENAANAAGSNYDPGHDTGCLAPVGEWTYLVSPASAETKLTNIGGTFCAVHDTLATLLDNAGLSWKYYAPAMENNPYPNNPTQLGYNRGGSIWTAPNSIYSICQPTADYRQCTGSEYATNLDLNAADVLRDISKCTLPAVSWVIPEGRNSDHPGTSQSGGPSWVASVVNAIGTNTSCGHRGYWYDTAIIVTWDDWGGWYDHEKPTVFSGAEGDYQLGFRVPLLFVSAHTVKATVSNARYDFGSILRFIEGNFELRQGWLGFADARSNTDLHELYNFRLGPFPFQPVPAPLGASFFLNDKRPPLPPDND
jgi:phospholipase C